MLVSFSVAAAPLQATSNASTADGQSCTDSRDNVVFTCHSSDCVVIT
jgi:hypothetical protein